ncbi:MAG: biopolymer transporter ExbD [bacterium]|nr:biopolymer transporter ExbD [bacterium]
MIDYNKYREGEGLFSGINIVPFTDVVLVLLIIFMIAAPGLLSSGLNVTLPGSASADPKVPAKVTVSLDRAGVIYLEGRALGDAQALIGEIAALIEKRPDLGVVLNADAAARHGQVVEVLDTLRKSGAAKIYVGTVKK